MNKKNFVYICLSLICMSPLVSAVRAPVDTNPPPEEQPEDPVYIEDSDPLYTAEFRAAAFFPMGHKFRKIYGDVGLSLQAEAGRTFKDHRNLGVWGNVEWIFMDGKPRSHCGRTSIDIFNFSFGLKGIGRYFDNTLFVYGGIGPDIGFIYLENKQRCCSSCHRKTRHRDRVAVGGILKSGAHVYLSRHFYLSFFADYLYLPVHFKNTVDVGGFKVGGGLGGRF